MGPSVVRVATSPTAIVAAGGGFGIGELAHLPVEAAVVVGVGAWALRMAAALVGSIRRRRRQDQPVVVDPWAVPEPWKSLVAQAVAGRDRFAQAMASVRPGPLHDRLAPLSAQVDMATEEVFGVAQQAAGLARAVTLADAEGLGDQLRRLQSERTARGAATVGTAGDAREVALAAQLKSARAMEATANQTEARLRNLVANLNDLVTTVTAIGLDASGAPATDRLAGSLDGVVGDLKTLQQALQETAALPPGGATS